MFDDVPRRRLHARQHVLGERLDAIAELDPDALTNVINGLIAKNASAPSPTKRFVHLFTLLTRAVPPTIRSPLGS